MSTVTATHVMATTEAGVLIGALARMVVTPSGSVRIARTLSRLLAGRRRLEHRPTLGQIRAMARLDGREPCSYRLEAKVNFVPEPIRLGDERELGRHALCFTVHDTNGLFVTEIVAIRDGRMFDPLDGRPVGEARPSEPTGVR